jgi:predicted HTH domain antitoxin
MTITLELPQDIESQLLEEWNGQLSHKILEAIAVDGYRQGTLSRGQVSELLSLSFTDTETFLVERAASSPFDWEDLEQGRAALENLLARRL